MFALTQVVLAVIQVALIGASLALPNSFLSSNAFWLYGAQSLSLFAYLLPRLQFAKNLFLPSFFILVYVSVNMTLGGYLAPRATAGTSSFQKRR